MTNQEVYEVEMPFQQKFEVVELQISLFIVEYVHVLTQTYNKK